VLQTLWLSRKFEIVFFLNLRVFFKDLRGLFYLQVAYFLQISVLRIGCFSNFMDLSLFHFTVKGNLACVCVYLLIVGMT